MAEAKITWVFTFKGPHIAMKEQGHTIEEATKDFPPEWFPHICIERREWDKYAWPGGYPLYYFTKDGGCLCSKCATDNLEQTLGDDSAWKIEQVDINYEDTSLYCDNCNKTIESAYGENDDDQEAD